MLLIPAAQVFAWLTDPSNGERLAFGISIALISILILINRIVGRNEMLFVWVPLAWAVLYAAAWIRLGRRSAPQETPSQMGQLVSGTAGNDK
jgi:hypothetical protein